MIKILSGSFWMSDIYGYKVKGTKIENLYSIEGAWKDFKEPMFIIGSKIFKIFQKNIIKIYY